MGGRARKVQERRILDRRAAAGIAAHRNRGCDAGFARGEGLCRGLAAAQRTRGDRHSQRDEARDRGAARAARRGAGARQGRARRLQVRGAVQRPAGVGGGEAAGGLAAAQARRTRPGRAAARAGDTVGHLARRRDRVEDVEQAGPDLRRNRPAMPTRSPPPRPRRGCSPIPNCRGRARMRRPRCSRSSISARRATT